MRSPKGGDSPHEVTQLLQAWSDGSLEARDRVMALVYEDLRRKAAAHLRRERPGHTLQPTALVHEAYVRLADQHNTTWQNRAQFLAVVSRIMRRILVDHARARLATKRSGRWARVALEAEAATVSPNHIDVLDLDAALDRLAAFDARKSRIAEMKFFGGLSLEEMSEVLGLSSKTVERDWQAARAWLFKTLSAPGESRHDS